MQQRSLICSNLLRMNRLLRSWKKSKNLAGLVALLKSSRPVDWGSWVNRELVDLLGFYIEIGWCKQYDNEITQYRAFLHAVDRFSARKEEILRKIIRTVPGLKVYMVLHSVFRITAPREDDWFVQFMVEELRLTDEEMAEATKAPEIPQEFLDALKDFDPEPVGLVMDNVRLEYKLWGHPKRGESPMPIHIIETDWEKIESEAPPDPEQFLSQYDEIDAGAIAEEVYNLEEDDLPF